VINGENYIVVNYRANSVVRSIWVLWNAEDRFFSPSQELECPFEPDGRMRSACISHAEKLVVQDVQQLRPPFRLLLENGGERTGRSGRTNTVIAAFLLDSLT
jgi:hypothetical protein